MIEYRSPEQNGKVQFPELMEAVSAARQNAVRLRGDARAVGVKSRGKLIRLLRRAKTNPEHIGSGKQEVAMREIHRLNGAVHRSIDVEFEHLSFYSAGNGNEYEGLPDAAEIQEIQTALRKECKHKIIGALHGRANPVIAEAEWGRRESELMQTYEGPSYTN